MGKGDAIIGHWNLLSRSTLKAIHHMLAIEHASPKQIIHRHLLLYNPAMLAIRHTVGSNHCQMHGLLGNQGIL